MRDSLAAANSVEKFESAKWYERLAMPLTLLIAMGCSDQQTVPILGPAGQLTSSESKSKESSIWLAAERAFSIEEASYPGMKNFIEGIEVKFHLGPMICASVGKLSICIDRDTEKSFLVLDVKTSHRLFPDTKVGLSIQNVVSFSADDGSEVIAIRFIGTDKQGHEQQLNVLLGDAKQTSMVLDIYADLNLRTMEGALQRIDATYQNALGQHEILRVSGDPALQHMNLTIIPDDGQSEASILIKRKLY